MTGLFAILGQTPYENRLKGLRGAFDNRTTDPTDMTGALILFGVVAGAAIIWIVARRWSQRNEGNADTHRAMHLFDTINRKLGLSWRDRFILRMFARATHLPKPVVIMFDESLFDRHAERWLDSLSFAPLRGRGRASLNLLRSRSFPTEGTDDRD